MNLYTRKNSQLEYFKEDRKELPCKDLDIDCLPDNKGDVPFGSYQRCFLYDFKKGSCPFLPMDI